MKNRKGTILVLIIFTAFIAAVMFLPGLISAGSLEPSTAPASTMKTLDEIPPTWSQTIAGSERFDLVLGGAGVLDKETGLVWEQSPSNTYYTWYDALAHCYELEVGGRKGWHLPTIEQLASLEDTTMFDPSLPSGHPFDTDCTSGGCVCTLGECGSPIFNWSSTTAAGLATSAWGADFIIGLVQNGAKTGTAFAWCVRGGQSPDAY
jgi:hypothetical protein